MFPPMHFKTLTHRDSELSGFTVQPDPDEAPPAESALW
jgi:hypothetical protein